MVLAIGVRIPVPEHLLFAQTDLPTPLCRIRYIVRHVSMGYNFVQFKADIKGLRQLLGVYIMLNAPIWVAVIGIFLLINKIIDFNFGDVSIVDFLNKNVAVKFTVN